MKKIVLRFGLASGFIIVALASITLPLCMNGTLDHSEIVGYTTMVLAFLMVFFGIRSYRDNVAAGAIGFGKAFQVGILITLITCAVYVVGWEIAYFNFFPNFLDQYTASVLQKMRVTGATEAEIQAKAATLAEMAKHYHNVFYNSAVTFMEIFPVGLIMTLVSAAILRRKPSPGAPAEAVPA
jgi:hypothetical protein